MLFDCVPGALFPLGALRENRRAKLWITESAWNMETRSYRRGIVYKTHDYPPSVPLPDFTRVIYTFADPTEVIFSLMKQDRKLGRSWIDEHYLHLRVPSGDFDRITEEDTLELGAHFRSWHQPQAFPLLCIKYRALWSSEEILSDFLGRKVKLPPYRERQTDLSQLSPEDVEKVRHTYAGLIEEMEIAPDCQLYPALRQNIPR
jgi:hypothetical protein